ncbi:MAG: hypothetical protein OXC63_01655 [Aestuariivita sp.]|nr:hypothetical protein [Aestuariivita sp.]
MRKYSLWGLIWRFGQKSRQFLFNQSRNRRIVVLASQKPSAEQNLPMIPGPRYARRLTVLSR